MYHGTPSNLIFLRLCTTALYCFQRITISVIFKSAPSAATSTSPALTPNSPVYLLYSLRVVQCSSLCSLSPGDFPITGSTCLSHSNAPIFSRQSSVVLSFWKSFRVKPSEAFLHVESAPVASTPMHTARLLLEYFPLTMSLLAAFTPPNLVPHERYA